MPVPLAACARLAPVAPESLDTGSVAVRKGASVLFGRGLLYVVVWSMQLVVSSLISPVLAHLMPPAEFGVLASAIALYQALVVLAVLGIDQASVLQRAEDGDDRRARGLLAVGMITAIVVTVAALTTIPLWADAAGFVGNHPLLLVAVLWTGPGRHRADLPRAARRPGPHPGLRGHEPAVLDRRLGHRPRAPHLGARRRDHLRVGRRRRPGRGDGHRHRGDPSASRRPVRPQDHGPGVHASACRSPSATCRTSC